MEDMKSREPVLHAVVKEFLESVGYEDTISAYTEELQKNNITVDMDALPSQMEDESIKKKEAFTKSFKNGNYKSFWLLWKEHVSESLKNENDTQRLEFKLQLYYAVYPMTTDETRITPVESSMQEFKSYLETNGASLSQTTEFVTFYALPFVPNPKSHPTFQALFEETWRDELKESLEKFLNGALFSEPLPQLYKLHVGADRKLQEGKAEQEQTLTDLKKQLKLHENRASEYFKKFAKLQGDYHNLIGISAELVDSLEKCVRGQMITPEYLQNICQRLFGQTADQSVDLSKPGTTSNLLRASIANENILISTSLKDSHYPSLDYNKIQVALESDLDDKKKTLLLQALIWRMTKSDAGEQRDGVITAYISNDILGCESKATVSSYVTEIFESSVDMVSEYLSRFINTVASFATGRVYLAQSELLIKKLVRMLMKTKNESSISENVLGALQKLSLRRRVQSTLIDSAVVEWLFKMLEEPDNLSDYALEYTVALLMNLCLRTTGKKKCCLHPEKILKLLIDLLSYDNQEIRPYINGTLYSILSLPSIKAAAIHMGLEEILNSYMQDETQDQHQLRFIIKQLNTVELRSDDEMESEGEDDDDDDDDEEGDAVDAESDKDETVTALLDEQSGEELLCAQYLHKSAVKPSVMKNKKIRQSVDEPFTRPVTPATRPNKTQSNIELSTHQPEVLISQERPRTSSSKGSRRPPAEQARARDVKPNAHSKQHQGGKSFKQAFATRPKIPRTPDTGSESGSRPTSSTEMPPLTRSISPPRPASGKAPKSSSKTSPR